MTVVEVENVQNIGLFENIVGWWVRLATVIETLTEIIHRLLSREEI